MLLIIVFILFFININNILILLLAIIGSINEIGITNNTIDINGIYSVFSSSYIELFKYFDCGPTFSVYYSLIFYLILVFLSLLNFICFSVFSGLYDFYITFFDIYSNSIGHFKRTQVPVFFFFYTFFFFCVLIS